MANNADPIRHDILPLSEKVLRVGGRICEGRKRLGAHRLADWTDIRSTLGLIGVVEINAGIGFADRQSNEAALGQLPAIVAELGTQSYPRLGVIIGDDDGRER